MVQVVVVVVGWVRGLMEPLSEVFAGAHNPERATAMLFFFFNVKELSWLRIKSLLLMTHLLVIGFSKAIRGKGLSKNKPTCENAFAWAQYGS